MSRKSNTRKSNIAAQAEFQMVFREQREKTFRDWPFDSGPCTAEKMAEAGFYHCPTDQEPDLVKCFFCLKELDGWEPEDKPWDEHKSHSGKCLFLQHDEDELTVKQFLELIQFRQITRTEKEVKARVEEFEECAADHRKEMMKLAS